MPERTESLGLRTLEDISTLILHSHDLKETLDNIVALVAGRMNSDVCSIYLLDDDNETLRLKSTKGLAHSSVGKITMKITEGLTGLVLEKRDIVSLENAHEHPRYKYFPESGEERYQSFLGIPLVQNHAPIGVIVIQHRETRAYSRTEASTLSTIACQITSIVINARLLDSIRHKDEERARLESKLEKIRLENLSSSDPDSALPEKNPLILTGTPVAPGFAVGKIYLLGRRNPLEAVVVEKVMPPEEEHERVLQALEKTRIQTLYLEKRVAGILSEDDAAIFHTHLLILEDRGFINKILDLVDQGHGAGRAIREVVNYYITAFAQMEDPYMRSRSADMEDIGRRVLESLEGGEVLQEELLESRLLVSSEIFPSDLATLDMEKILGIVTEKGDLNSHAAIIARSLGIPAVMGIEGLVRQIEPDDDLIVDGNIGHVYINPHQRIRSEYERLQRDYSLKMKGFEGLRDLPAITRDGVRVFLRANIGLVSDIRVAVAQGAEGVGLYRTEFPFMARKAFPDRHEQSAIYKKILAGFAGQPLTIRTLDIGGDKGLPYFSHPAEENPFMGWRAIRISLDCCDIFREQLAAILMTAKGSEVRIMFPMISGIEEVRAIRQLIREVMSELELAGIPFKSDIPLGIMVETPAAVLGAEILAKEVDFFSIGTNDLIQYTLAADRNNSRVKQYYTPYHPAVIHSIRKVVLAAKTGNISVSLCGEMAASPANALLLMGLGITDFSMSAPSIPVVKQAIRSVSAEYAERIAGEVLLMESNLEIKEYMHSVELELERIMQ